MLYNNDKLNELVKRFNAECAVKLDRLNFALSELDATRRYLDDESAIVADQVRAELESRVRELTRYVDEWRRHGVVLKVKCVPELEYETLLRRLLLANRWISDVDDTTSVNSRNGGASTVDKDATCEFCGSSEFESNEAAKNKICVNCSAHTKYMETGHTHQDYNRVNIVGKFQYNRDFHFLNCIKQFQGRQNCKIPTTVFDSLDAKFKAYGLLVDSDDVYIRHSKITIQHILLFLKDLKLTKHYENANAIYFALTNKRVADISHLEADLLDDFKCLLNVYDEMFVKDRPKHYERKNFMNVNYILYQLLKKRGYECRLEDFSMLKTAVGKMFHDDICGKLFAKLGWKFTPTY